MPELNSYDYAVVRVVPSIERAEFLNAGIILFAKSLHFLEARVSLDPQRLAALAEAEAGDTEAIRAHLESVERICTGGPAAGPIGGLSQSQRFHWLVAPRSTVIQTSPVHSGLCEDPRVELERLYERLVS